MRHRRTCWLAFGVTLLVGRTGLASDPSLRERSDTAFKEGRELLARGALVEACQRFRLSYELLPRNGTLLNLAVCLEQSGDLAGAFRRFEEGLAAAISDGRRDRQELARRHIEELRPKLAWLSFNVGGSEATATLKVEVDGTAWPTPDQSRVLEPGEHVVVASAPGHEAVKLTVLMSAGKSRVVDIPPLPVAQPDPAPAATATVVLAPAPVPSTRASTIAVAVPPADTATRSPWRRPATLAFVGGGAVSLVVGSIAGARAILDGRAVRRSCPELRCSSEEALDDATALRDRARTEARVADVALPLGLLALGVGLYLGWSDRTTKPTAGNALTPTLRLATARSASSLGAEMSATW